MLFVLCNSVYTCIIFFFFFFNDTATTEIYTLSLHDALPISALFSRQCLERGQKVLMADRTYKPIEQVKAGDKVIAFDYNRFVRSEEHTSELQSRQYLVCRLLLEKKKKNHSSISNINIIIN